MRKLALITGATSGIGRATSILFASNNIDVIICGRRAEHLDEVERIIDGKVLVHKLSFDVSKKDEVEEALSSISNLTNKIDILVNNAGNAHGLSPIHEGSLEDWDKMIDINVKGLLYISRKVIPGMVERKSGQIINLGSIAGKEVYPNGNVYCASKFAVDAINQSMRIDLHKFGIRVASINPGMVNTEFSQVRFKGDKERSKAVYSGLLPLSAEDIADIIWFISTRPPHVNISDLTVFPTSQATATLVTRDL